MTKDGLGAVEAPHRALIEPAIRTEFGDSLDLDEAFRAADPQGYRWDYLLGHNESGEIIALEPHSAHNKEVSVVIKKRAGALMHLRGHLKASVAVAEWFWVASGRVDFIPMEKAVARLNENGIRFVGRYLTKKMLPKRRK